ncbi:HD domain-containing protein [Proteiniclasticum sp. C24MP]|uniref:HD domain-containing protein n=1 Tax=Proteiniclasticum sp. C24MP TaxID=3374101 RepID=UPI00375528D5
MEKEKLKKLPLFERALILAAGMHAGQKDKGGQPYVMHVIRVMMELEEMELKVAALLHDLLEDTDLSAEELLSYGFSEDLIGIVRILSRDPKEPYMDYIKDLAGDERAIKIKLSDLKDNQNRTRLKENLSSEDLERMEKYHRAEEYLLGVLYGRQV